MHSLLAIVLPPWTLFVAVDKFPPTSPPGNDGTATSPPANDGTATTGGATGNKGGAGYRGVPDASEINCSTTTNPGMNVCTWEFALDLLKILLDTVSYTLQNMVGHYVLHIIKPCILVYVFILCCTLSYIIYRIWCHQEHERAERSAMNWLWTRDKKNCAHVHILLSAEALRQHQTRNERAAPFVCRSQLRLKRSCSWHFCTIPQKRIL